MLKSIIKFARVRIIATCFALVFLGSAAAGSITLKTILAFILIVAFTIHANSINDYSDRDIDKINLKDAHDRPLVTKDITNAQFWAIHFASGFVMLGLSIFYGLGGIILTLAVIFIDYIYSLKPLRITDRTFASPVLLAIAYTYYSFSLGFWSVHTNTTYPWLLTIGLCFGFVARLLLKDFRDVKGDKQHGKITFLLRFGSKLTSFVSGVFWIAAMLVVFAATSFPIGIIVPLSLGSIMVCKWLFLLSKERSITHQQELVAIIAKAANIAIITILAYLLCRQNTGLSATQKEVIPLVVGLVLLTFNWFQNLNYGKLIDVRSN